MSKGVRLSLGVLAAFLCLSALHVWLNVGFDRLGLFGGEKAEQSFRVGFLPVT